MLPIQALQRHEKAVHSMAVVHDTVFTGSEDQEIKVSVDLYDFVVEFLVQWSFVTGEVVW